VSDRWRGLIAEWIGLYGFQLGPKAHLFLSALPLWLNALYKLKRTKIPSPCIPECS